MTSPITDLTGTDKVRDSMDTLNTNFARRHAWNIVTLTDADDGYQVLPTEGGTLFRLDGSAGALTVLLAPRAEIYVGFCVRFVAVAVDNTVDINPDTDYIYGLDGGPASHKELTAQWARMEFVWDGAKWLVTDYYEPAP